MARVIILFALFVALQPGAALAQRNRPPAPPQGASAPQGFKWWQSDNTRNELGLTSDQSAKIEDIFQSVMPRLRLAFEDIDRGERQLSKLISANDTTEVDVVRQLGVLQVAKNEADRQRTLMLFRMQRVLTPDQRTKFKAMRERWQQEREQRGRRGTDGPPPSAIAQTKK